MLAPWWYMFALAGVFGVLALHKPHRNTMLTLAFTTLALAIFRETLSKNDWPQWAAKVSVTWLSAVALLRVRTPLAVYHAAVQLGAMTAYSSLYYDTFLTSHYGWVYDNYEGIIYGLVGLQLLGLYPTCGALCQSGYSALLFYIPSRRSRLACRIVASGTTEAKT